MWKLYDNRALRHFEACALHEGGLDEAGLMRRAGAEAWALLRAHWPCARRIRVLTGPGNNGGDGWVLAQHARAAGLAVEVVAALPPRTPLAQQMAAEYHAAGGTSIGLHDVPAAADVLVDALFGIGLERPLQGELAAWIKALNASGLPILSLDVPSGVNADTGEVPGEAIRATRTVQFIAAHAGLATGAARHHAGLLSLATLDVPAHIIAQVAPRAEIFVPARLPARRRDAHKGHCGHGLLVGGEHGMGGAVMLAGEAALRGGIGLLTVATRPAHVTPLLARRPEAMVHGLATVDAIAPLLAAADVLAVGPGLGQGEWGQALLAAALSSSKPCVLDADALNLLARYPVPCPQAILTPHPGEAARLLQTEVAHVQRDRLAAAEALAERYRCSVLLKGAGTVLAAPASPTRVLDVGNPGMASGGMGDALTGVILALLGQGLPAFDAASTAGWLHGRAGDLAAATLGEASLLAGDLITCLPEAIKSCHTSP